MNVCAFFGVKIVKSKTDPIKKTPCANGSMRVSFQATERIGNSFATHQFTAFDEVANKIINMKLEPKMRVNIVAVVGKYGEAGEQKYCFKILLIDYADPKSTEKTELAQVLTLASKQVKLTDGDIFSQLLPEDFKLL